MEVVDIDIDDHRISEVFRVLVQLRPHIDEQQFREIYANGRKEGLRFSALYDNERCVAVAGWRIINTTHPVRKMYVDDLITDEKSRSGGHGHALMTHLKDRAREAGCTMLDLDSGVQRFDAHRFYLREGMHIGSHHFVIELEA